MDGSESAVDSHRIHCWHSYDMSMSSMATTHTDVVRGQTYSADSAPAGLNNLSFNISLPSLID